MDSDSLKVTDAASAAVAVAPRVSLAQIEAAMAARYHFTMGRAIRAMGLPDHGSLDVLSVCVVVMKNGFTVVGKSAPASEANFNVELGERFAYEDAVRQIWPLAGFALRETMHGGMFANLQAPSPYPPPPAMERAPREPQA